MKKVRCIFCDNESEKAKEHIWPRWLQNHLVGSTRHNYHGVYLNFMRPDLIDHRNQSGESLVFGSVCKSCNSGWMNKLENEFKIYFEKIQSNYNYIRTLSKQERVIIAFWGLKTAMMINAGSNYRQIIPFNHYKHLYIHKQIPKNIKIDIGYLTSNKLLTWEQSNISSAIHKNSDLKSYDPTYLSKNSYIISMQIEHLGIKVAYYKDCKEKGAEITTCCDNRSIRIWPFCKNGQFRINKSYQELEDFQIDTHLFL